MYRGKWYPCVDVELTEEEADKHYESECKTFADEELANEMENSGKWEETDNSDGEIDIEGEIDWYAKGQICRRFSEGEIPVNEMKIKIARIILTW